MAVQQVQLSLVQNALWNLLSAAIVSSTGSAYAGAFGNTYVGLFVGPWPGFSLGLQQSQLTEPGYTGYARVKATWSTQGIDPTGRPQVWSQEILWEPTGSGGTALVLGVFLSDALTGGHLLGVSLLQTPVNLNVPTDQAALSVRLAMPVDPANWGIGSMDT